MRKSRGENGRSSAAHFADLAEATIMEALHLGERRRGHNPRRAAATLAVDRRGGPRIALEGHDRRCNGAVGPLASTSAYENATTE